MTLVAAVYRLLDRENWATMNVSEVLMDVKHREVTVVAVHDVVRYVLGDHVAMYSLEDNHLLNVDVNLVNIKLFFLLQLILQH